MTPKQKARTAVEAKVRDIIARGGAIPAADMVNWINATLAGWVNYFRIGNSSRAFSEVRDHVEMKSRTLLTRRKRWRKRSVGWRRWNNENLDDVPGQVLPDSRQIRTRGEHHMKTRIGFSLLTLLAVGGIGLVLGTVISERHPSVAFASPAAMAPAPDDGKLRIIIFGAHPDDAEYFGAGVAMKWAKAGHHVKLVSSTNGDVGHWQIAGGPLAQRRKAEVLEVARRLGVTTEVLDIHDGEILPTLENRRIFTRLIRQWNADVVITNRPNDYHPDHRYTSILVQDSAYMVTVPFFGMDEPPLKKNPVFAYSADRFKRPYPFTADLAVAIDDVIEPTLDALLVMESQIQEGGANGNAALFPTDGPGRQQRRDVVRKNLANRYARNADNYRDALVKFYGDERARQVHYAQAFEICEYGSQPTQEQIRKLFPF